MGKGYAAREREAIPWPVMALLLALSALVMLLCYQAYDAGMIPTATRGVSATRTTTGIPTSTVNRRDRQEAR